MSHFRRNSLLLNMYGAFEVPLNYRVSILLMGGTDARRLKHCPEGVYFTGVLLSFVLTLAEHVSSKKQYWLSGVTATLAEVLKGLAELPTHCSSSSAR